MSTGPSVGHQEPAHEDPIAESDIDAFSDLLDDDRRLWEAFEAADSHH